MEAGNNELPEELLQPNGELNARQCNQCVELTQRCTRQREALLLLKRLVMEGAGAVQKLNDRNTELANLRQWTDVRVWQLQTKNDQLTEGNVALRQQVEACMEARREVNTLRESLHSSKGVCETYRQQIVCLEGVNTTLSQSMKDMRRNSDRTSSDDVRVSELERKIRELRTELSTARTVNTVHVQEIEKLKEKDQQFINMRKQLWDAEDEVKAFRDKEASCKKLIQRGLAYSKPKPAYLRDLAKLFGLQVSMDSTEKDKPKEKKPSVKEEPVESTDEELDEDDIADGAHLERLMEEGNASPAKSTLSSKLGRPKSTTKDIASTYQIKDIVSSKKKDSDKTKKKHPNSTVSDESVEKTAMGDSNKIPKKRKTLEKTICSQKESTQSRYKAEDTTPSARKRSRKRRTLSSASLTDLSVTASPTRETTLEDEESLPDDNSISEYLQLMKLAVSLPADEPLSPLSSLAEGSVCRRRSMRLKKQSVLPDITVSDSLSSLSSSDEGETAELEPLAVRIKKFKDRTSRDPTAHKDVSTPDVVTTVPKQASPKTINLSESSSDKVRTVKDEVNHTNDVSSSPARNLRKTRTRSMKAEANHTGDVSSSPGRNLRETKGTGQRKLVKRKSVSAVGARMKTWPTSYFPSNHNVDLDADSSEEDIAEGKADTSAASVKKVNSLNEIEDHSGVQEFLNLDISSDNLEFACEDPLPESQVRSEVEEKEGNLSSASMKATKKDTQTDAQVTSLQKDSSDLSQPKYLELSDGDIVMDKLSVGSKNDDDTALHSPTKIAPRQSLAAASPQKTSNCNQPKSSELSDDDIVMDKLEIVCNNADSSALQIPTKIAPCQSLAPVSPQKTSSNCNQPKSSELSDDDIVMDKLEIECNNADSTALQTPTKIAPCQSLAPVSLQKDSSNCNQPKSPELSDDDIVMDKLEIVCKNDGAALQTPTKIVPCQSPTAASPQKTSSNCNQPKSPELSDDDIVMDKLKIVCKNDGSTALQTPTKIVPCQSLAAASPQKKSSDVCKPSVKPGNDAPLSKKPVENNYSSNPPNPLCESLASTSFQNVCVPADKAKASEGTNDVASTVNPVVPRRRVRRRSSDVDVTSRITTCPRAFRPQKRKTTEVTHRTVLDIVAAKVGAEAARNLQYVTNFSNEYSMVSPLSCDDISPSPLSTPSSLPSLSKSSKSEQACSSSRKRKSSTPGDVILPKVAKNEDQSDVEMPTVPTKKMSEKQSALISLYHSVMQFFRCTKSEGYDFGTYISADMEEDKTFETLCVAVTKSVKYASTSLLTKSKCRTVNENEAVDERPSYLSPTETKAFDLLVQLQDLKPEVDVLRYCCRQVTKIEKMKKKKKKKKGRNVTISAHCSLLRVCFAVLRHLKDMQRSEVVLYDMLSLSPCSFFSTLYALSCVFPALLEHALKSVGKSYFASTVKCIIRREYAEHTQQFQPYLDGINDFCDGFRVVVEEKSVEADALSASLLREVMSCGTDCSLPFWCLSLLCRKLGWEWTKNVVVVKQLMPKLKSLQRATSASGVVRCLGMLCQHATPTDGTVVVKVLRHLQAYVTVTPANGVELDADVKAEIIDAMLSLGAFQPHIVAITAFHWLNCVGHGNCREDLQSKIRNFSITFKDKIEYCFQQLTGGFGTA